MSCLINNKSIYFFKVVFLTKPIISQLICTTTLLVLTSTSFYSPLGHKQQLINLHKICKDNYVLDI